MAFELHPNLKADTTWIGDFPLCRILLSKEDIGPWFILVPKVEGMRELHQLSEDQQQQFIKESSWLSSKIERFSYPDKLNIAALGNMVPQLHIHHIARYQTDVAWPHPVWGNTPGIIREPILQDETAQRWRQHLGEVELFTSA